MPGFARHSSAAKLTKKENVVPDEPADRFGTFLPEPDPPAGEAPTTKAGDASTTDPGDTSTRETRLVSTPGQRRGDEKFSIGMGETVDFDAKVGLLTQRMTELEVWTSEEFDIVQKSAGANADQLGVVLRVASTTPCLRKIKFEKADATILTEFQVREILAGNLERLRLQNCLLREKLGEGGMGQVYKAWNVAIGRVEAIKTMLTDASGMATAGAQAEERFQREARIQAQLDHEAVTEIYHFGRERGVDFISMEFVEGRTLQQWVEDANHRRERLPIGEACSLIRRAALALEHAHENGVVHRDVKPNNLMITPQGALKVLDLGIARLMDPRATVSGSQRQLTIQARAMGTPEVMPPEQWADASAVTFASDIYSLGCTLFFALTGRMPFRGDTLNALMMAHVTDAPPKVSAVRPDAPRELDAIVAKMLAKKPEERFASCQQVADALAPFAPDESLVSAATGKGRGPGLLIGLSAALVIAIVVAVVIWTNGGRAGVDLAAIDDWLVKHQAEAKRVWPDIVSLRGAAHLAEIRSDADWEKRRGEIVEETRQRTANLASLDRRATALVQQWPGVWASAPDALRETRIPLERMADAKTVDAIMAELEKVAHERTNARIRRELEAFRVANADVWPEAAGFEAFLKTIPGFESSSSPLSLEETLAAVADETHRRRATSLADEWKATHRVLWPNAKELERWSMEKTPKTGSGSEIRHQAQRVFETETRKRLTGWRDQLADKLVKEYPAAWMSVVEAEASLGKLSDGASLEDEGLNKLASEFTDEARRLGRPFDGLRRVPTGDSLRDYHADAYLATLRWLASYPPAAEDKRVDLQLRMLVDGKPVNQLVAGPPVVFEVKTSRKGYLTTLYIEANGGGTLLRAADPLEPGKWRPFSEASFTPGNDRMLAFLTETDPTSLGPDRPPSIRPMVQGSHDDPTWLRMLADTLVTEPVEPDSDFDRIAKPVLLTQITSWFSAKEQYARVIAIVEGKRPGPLDPTKPSVGWLARRVIPLTIQAAGGN